MNPALPGEDRFPYGPEGGPDPGPPGAIERTSLAWQRTALSTVAGAVLLARLNFDSLGIWALAPVVPALSLGAWLMLEGRWRYRHAIGERLRGGSHGGIGPAMLSVAVALMCLTGLATILTV